MTVAYHRKPVLWDVDLTLDEPQPGRHRRAQRGGQEHADQGDAGPGAARQRHASASSASRSASSGERIGYVPQRESVDWDFPVSVLDVVLMGTYGRLGWFRRPGAAERALGAANASTASAWPTCARQQIGQLSGGQQQRTFLARALAQQADIYFMDEPMAGVDAATEQVDLLDCCDELRDAGQDGARRASRSADRARVFRPRRAAEHAAGRQRPDRRACSPTRTCRRPTAAGWTILDDGRRGGPCERRAEQHASHDSAYNTADRAGSASGAARAPSAGLVGSFAVLRPAGR